MSPRKQLALKRRKSVKTSMKMKMAKMLAARHNKTPIESVPQSTSLPQPHSAPPSSPPHTPPSTSTAANTPRPSASSRKLLLCAPSHTTKETSLPTTITSFDVFGTILSGTLCSSCYGNNLMLRGDPAKDQGLAIYLCVVCGDCDTICSSAYTSSKLSSHAYDVNKRLVSSSLAAGINYSGLARFCELMNMPVLSQKTHHNYTERVEEEMSSEVLAILKSSGESVREHYAHEDDTPLEIAVSFDGSWPKRGHCSRLGIGAVIEVKTGLVLDFHVMSTYCQPCSNTGKELSEKNPLEYERWAEKHKPSCTINFEGTAGAMEVEAAKVLWSRSLELHNMRYTTMVSDGDAKSFTAVQKLAPYGDVGIRKEECVNHVAKRLQTALRNLVSTESKRGVRLGGAAKGSLTQAKMAILQAYYTSAVRTYNGSVEQMSNAIWAAFYHSISTDADPQHSFCPQGEESWCFHQKAVAEGRVPPAHTDRRNATFLNERVAGYVKPIYSRLTDPALLERCLLGKTQNANESLHASVWSRCPKHLFGGLRRVRLAVALGVAEFNGGSRATHCLMAATGCPVTAASVEKGMGRDRRRVRKAEKASEAASKVRRRVQLVAKQREIEEQERREGGQSYVPGGF